MFRQTMTSNKYIGCHEFDQLVVLNDYLNDKVVQQLNESQELVMLNHFAQESNEFQIRKCLQERIADLESWRWVLRDLSKRLEEGIAALHYEGNAIKVIITRIEDEIGEHSRNASMPGALCPLSDSVEEAVMMEYKFLCNQKKKFERMIMDLQKHIAGLEKIKKRIDLDVNGKDKAITVEEKCVQIDVEAVKNVEIRKKKKKKASQLMIWERRCVALKKAGLEALSNCVITRQQVRGARAQLSMAAQAHATRVDSALRRRLHSNETKLEELRWQKNEVESDQRNLNDELRATEECLLANMDQMRVVEVRIAERNLKPRREMTNDHIDLRLKAEIKRLRQFTQDLRANIKRITSLQDTLSEAITRIDCASVDVLEVIQLDSNRIQQRQGDACECGTESVNIPETLEVPSLANLPNSALSNEHSTTLNPILEEDEDDDDYPFDY